MSFISRIIDIIAPRTCEICGGKVNGYAICDGCRSQLIRESFEHCPSCGRTASRCVCGREFTEKTHTYICGRRFYAMTFYKPENKFGKSERVTEKLLFGLKEHGRFAPIFAEEMSRAILRLFEDGGEDIGEWTVTYPPRSPENFFGYGFDQSELMAEHLARLLGCTSARTMVRGGTAVEQKTLDATMRMNNAKATLIPMRSRIKAGGKYILFDDIITSGATLNSAATVLYSAGAAEVFPVAIALTYRENAGNTQNR